MKKINLLKPDIHNGYLNHGKGQEINYLAIPDTIGISELKEDVKNGAAHFKEVIDFVAIETDNLRPSTIKSSPFLTTKIPFSSSNSLITEIKSLCLNTPSTRPIPNCSDIKLNIDLL